MKKIIFFTFLFLPFLVQGQQYDNLVFRYLLDSLMNENTFKKQCDCNDYYSPKTAIWILDSVSIDPDPFILSMTLDGLNESFKAVKPLVNPFIETSDTKWLRPLKINRNIKTFRKIRLKSTVKLDKSHYFIRVLQPFDNNQFSIYTLWIKTDFFCSGIELWFLVDKVKNKVIGTDKVIWCDKWG